MKLAATYRCQWPSVCRSFSSHHRISSLVTLQDREALPPRVFLWRSCYDLNLLDTVQSASVLFSLCARDSTWSHRSSKSSETVSIIYRIAGIFRWCKFSYTVRLPTSNDVIVFPMYFALFPHTHRSLDLQRHSRVERQKKLLNAS